MPVVEIDPIESPSFPSVPQCLRIEPDAGPFAWMLAMLQQAMEGVMTGEAPPLQKASAIARLGNLYLKTSRAAELQKENRELTRRLVALEKRLAAVEGPDASTEVGSTDQPRQNRSSSAPVQRSGDAASSARPPTGAPLPVDASPVRTCSNRRAGAEAIPRARHAVASGRASP